MSVRSRTRAVDGEMVRSEIEEKTLKRTLTNKRLLCGTQA